MGYHTSNAAYAYDMSPRRMPGTLPPPHLLRVLALMSSPVRAVRRARQVSPQFTHCVKVFAVLAVLFVAIGVFRVALAGPYHRQPLNNAATLSNELTEAQEQSSELEVMRAVYGSSTRIRDLAEGYGMVTADSVSRSISPNMSIRVPTPARVRSLRSASSWAARLHVFELR